MKILDYTEDIKGVKVQFLNTNPIGVLKASTEGEKEVEKEGEKGGEKEGEKDRIEVVDVDILVGADGIRSVVRQLRSKKAGILSNNKVSIIYI
jgi:flavin-dependent dehydrogenase